MTYDLANGSNIGKQCRNSQNRGERPIPGKLLSEPREPDQISAGGQKALEGRCPGKNIKDHLIYLTIWKAEVIVKDS